MLRNLYVSLAYLLSRTTPFVNLSDGHAFTDMMLPISYSRVSPFVAGPSSSGSDNHGVSFAVASHFGHEVDHLLAPHIHCSLYWHSSQPQWYFFGGMFLTLGHLINVRRTVVLIFVQCMYSVVDMCCFLDVNLFKMSNKSGISLSGVSCTMRSRVFVLIALAIHFLLLLWCLVLYFLGVSSNILGSSPEILGVWSYI